MKHLDEDIELYKAGLIDVRKREEVQELEQDGMAWYMKMSNMEKKKISLARAMIYDPNIMVLHCPLHDADTELSALFLMLQREFVDNRGLELDPGELSGRRPRTVFFSVGANRYQQQADSWVDIVWSIKRTNIQIEKKTPQQHPYINVQEEGHTEPAETYEDSVGSTVALAGIGPQTPHADDTGAGSAPPGASEYAQSSRKGWCISVGPDSCLGMRQSARFLM